MRLNKFIARSGIASRREAEKLIQSAHVTINGNVELSPYYDVNKKDVVKYDSMVIKDNQDAIIIMLNKPKGYITSMKDPLKRKIVSDLINIKERIFPIGRLDKDTTGLLLFTNQGDLALRLSHPKYNVPKIYLSIIDRPFALWEKKKINKKVYIGQKEWGRADIIDQKKVKGKIVVKLKLFHGKKREIRRIMYRMKRNLYSLKRIEFGPCKLGNLKEGQWRSLQNKEISILEKYTYG
tara:strand:+ start:78 stop:788 length:711 start_codon:yes stop_codon:yes gene_type:complete